MQNMQPVSDEVAHWLWKKPSPAEDPTLTIYNCLSRTEKSNVRKCGLIYKDETQPRLILRTENPLI